MTDDDLDARDLYVAVRRGVYDAIRDVLGTLATVVLAGLLVLFGAVVAIPGLQSATTGGLLAAAFGTVMALLGVLQFLREFRLWPFG